MKKIFKYILIIFFGLLLAAIMLPFVFEDDIEQFIKEEINEQINGEISFDDLNLSLIRSFPKAQLDLDHFIIQSDFDRTGDTLAKISLVSLNMNVLDLLTKSQDIDIHSFTIQDGDVIIFQPKKGASNFDLFNDESAAEKNTMSYSVNLDEYALKNINLSFINEIDEIQSIIKGIDHQGNGNFNQDQFLLNTNTKIESINVDIDQTNYINELEFNMDAKVSIDQQNKQYKIDQGKFKIGDLMMSANASVMSQENGLTIDAEFNSETQSLKNYLRLIPGAFKGNLDKVTASGHSSLDLLVNGQLAPNHYPSFNLEVKTSEGDIKVQDVKERLSNLELDLLISSSKKDLSDLSVNVPKLNFNIDDQYVSASFNTKDVLDDPNFIGKLNADIDLKRLNNILQLEGLESIDGSLVSDVHFDVKQSHIDNERYDLMSVNGHAAAQELKIEMAKSLPIYIPQADVTFNPNKTHFKLESMELGESHINVEGNIENLMSILNDDSQIQAESTITGDYFNIEEWVSEDSQSEKTDYIIRDRWIINSKLDLKKIKYESYNVQDLIAGVVIKENDLKIDRATASINGSEVNMSGYLTNTALFAMENSTLLGELIVESPNFNASKFINGSQTENTQDDKMVRIPRNVKLLINAESDILTYQDYHLTDLNSKIFIHDGTASISGTEAKGFDGELQFEGLYDSKPDRPSFSMSYDLDRLNFAKLYKSSNMFSQLAPLAKYVTGFFNSDLKMSGNIDENFNPVLQNISADGFIETLNSQITGFPPLQSLANSLGIQSLKEFAIKNTKNWLTVENGRVIIKPTKHEVDGINMIVSGSHSLQQDINYTLQMEIPRELFKANDRLNIIDEGLESLSTEASSLGIDIFSGDYIYVKAEIGGTILKPTIKIKPTGSGGKNLSEQAEDAIMDSAEEIKKKYEDKANKKIEETKDTINDVVEQEIEKAQDKLDTFVQDTKNELMDKAEEIIKGQLDSSITDIVPDSIKTDIKDKLNDILNSDGKESDKLKEELDKLNPFKKKKKKN